jgi:molybdopterin synthase catalytic subunit
VSCIQVKITSEPLCLKEAIDFVSCAEHGAQTTFVGTVRNHHQGKQVLGITYDVFKPLAKQVLSDLCLEAQKKWGGKLYVSHIKGRLDVGGISVIIAAGSAHRDAAFQACRYLIEEIKHRCPIWKQEHFVDGSDGWVSGKPLI